MNVYNVDGSTTETIDNRRNNDTLLNRETLTINVNAEMKTIATDFHGVGLADNTVLTQTTLKTDGSSQVFAKQINLNGTVILNQWINVTANGLSTTVNRDYNWDSVVDWFSTEVTAYNADGSLLKHNVILRAQDMTGSCVMSQQ